MTARATRTPWRSTAPTLTDANGSPYRATVYACLGCHAKTPALTLADPLPAGWRCQVGARVTYWCPTCAGRGGRLDASGGWRP